MYSRGLSALAFTADFPPAAPKFHQRTHRVRLRNLGTIDKKSSRKIKYKKIPRVIIFKDCEGEYHAAIPIVGVKKIKHLYYFTSQP